MNTDAITPDQIDQYAHDHTTADSPLMHEIEQRTYDEMDSPQMLSGALVGRLLETLARTTQANRVLEIGTFTGYSALSILRGMRDDGTIITCEFNADTAAVARANIDEAGATDRIEVREGDALATLAELSGPFDLVFIDAAKSEYGAYLDAVLPMLSAHGVVAVDNTLWSGSVLDVGPGDDVDTTALAKFNRRIADDAALSVVVLPVRDGVTLITKR